MKSFFPIDLSKVTTYPLSQRKNKVLITDFATPPKKHGVFTDFLDSLPNILAAQDFRKFNLFVYP